jgi:uncharacterized spore protein YtfJ
MENTNVETLLKTSLGEIERVLSTKTVVGEPIQVDGITLIPLISIGFGFGAGGGGGKAKTSDEGSGAGIGGGGGIKPVAVIVIGKDGVHIAPVKSGTGLSEKLGELVGKAMEKMPKAKSDN